MFALLCRLPRPTKIGIMARCVILVYLVVLSAACGSMYNDGLKSDLEKRVAFDFDCPASKIQYHELSETNGMVTSYGVRGCGHQTTYVLNTQSGVWVQNSGDRAEK